MTELRVGVRELKAHLSEYLREIKQGKVIIITEHGKPVGRLSPAPLSVAEKMQALVTAGLAQWDGENPAPVKNRPTVRGPKTVAELLIEDRE